MAVDPGQVHVGYALWHDVDFSAQFSHCGEVGPEDIVPMIRDARPYELVLEDYSLLSPRFSKRSSKQAADTLKLIGRIQQVCEDLEIVVHMQQPSVRSVAQRSPFWRDMVMVHDLGSNPHSRAAVAHGVYRLHFRTRP